MKLIATALSLAVFASLGFFLSISTPTTPAGAADLKVCGSPDVQFLGFSDALNKQSTGGIPHTRAVRHHLRPSARHLLRGR